MGCVCVWGGGGDHLGPGEGEGVTRRSVNVVIWSYCRRVEGAG